MIEDREFYASTVDEAVARAAAELGRSPDELVFEVRDEGSSGFLGMGARDARIAVRVQDAEVSDVPEQDPISSDAATASAATTSAHTGAVEAPPLGSAAEDRDAVLSSEASESPGEEEVLAEAPDELLEEVRVLVSSVLEAMNFEAGVEVYDAGGYIAVDVTPDNTGLFIGQKGETIDALQYLVNVAAYKERPFVKRVVLDAEGYRQRRVEALQGMAHRTARRAVREHRAVELPPMSSSERRVVHLFLQENPGVTTQSEGSGENRRVRVFPA
ncbi:MAG: Jag N-terminal domain-containing protein [Actinomycetota bacterium]|nr:Jag N-terminal domain-containing protein [Actinomycetota bacterium]